MEIEKKGKRKGRRKRRQEIIVMTSPGKTIYFCCYLHDDVVDDVYVAVAAGEVAPDHPRGQVLVGQHSHLL